jgi:hypothetical protein
MARKKMRRAIGFVLIATSLMCVIVDAADARGRTGSFRVGGYNSHGKGSHYVGGR